jgi:hypothetical protein
MIAVGFVCALITVSMFVLSLFAIFRRPRAPGVVEERLDLALEAELIADSIERYANNERR